MARSKYKLRVAGLILKIVGAVLVASVLTVVLWRVIDSNIDPKSMNTMIANDIVCSEYEEHGNLTVIRQNQSKFTRGDNNYGYFAVTRALFIKEANQLQVVFRYNNSTLKHTKEDYNLSTVPSRDGEVYNISVTVMYDLTPENPNDNDGKTPEAVEYKRFHPSSSIKDQKTLYNYRKYVFDGIELTDNVIGVYLDVYYVGDVDYSETPYGSLLIFNNADKDITYRLTRNDIKALEAHGQN